MKNTLFKRFKRGLGRVAYNVLRTIIRVLPYPVYRIFARIFFAIGVVFMLPKRKIVYQNLRRAFGREKTKKEIKAIEKKYFQTFGRGMIDFIYFVYHPEIIENNVEIEGLHYLEEALADGKGVICTGGHFGNFLLMYWRMAQEGHQVNVIMRRVHDTTFEDYISEIRTKSSVRAIYDLPAKKCVVESIKALRNNELLFILLDQNYGSAGRIFVDFFGQLAATATGPVVFSLRTKAPILPIFCLKAEGELKHRIVIEKPILLEEGQTEEEIIHKNVSRITQLIESYVRQHPAEWGGWMHKRWKSKPHYEQDIIDRLNGVKKTVSTS